MLEIDMKPELEEILEFYAKKTASARVKWRAERLLSTSKIARTMISASKPLALLSHI
jgi:hypothetical protein